MADVGTPFWFFFGKFCKAKRVLRIITDLQLCVAAPEPPSSLRGADRLLHRSWGGGCCPAMSLHAPAPRFQMLQSRAQLAAPAATSHLSEHLSMFVPPL